MIAFDSDAFSLALKGVFNADRKSAANVSEESKRAEQGAAFLRKQIESGVPLMVSTVSLAEYMVLIPEDEHSEHLRQIKEQFQVYPFDDRAALVAARIRQSTMADKDVAAAYKGRKRLLRMDSLMLSVAIANHATSLVSYDNGVKALAEKAYPNRSLVIRFPVIGELQFDQPDQDS